VKHSAEYLLTEATIHQFFDILKDIKFCSIEATWYKFTRIEIAMIKYNFYGMIISLGYMTKPN